MNYYLNCKSLIESHEKTAFICLIKQVIRLKIHFCDRNIFLSLMGLKVEGSFNTDKFYQENNS